MVSCAVTNYGPLAGAQVVQLYVRDVIASVTTPVRMLKGFRRVFLEVGKSQIMTFDIDVANELKILPRTGEDWIVESGEFQVHIGYSSDNTPLSGSFVVI